MVEVGHVTSRDLLLKLRCELFGIAWNILKLVADDDLQKVLLRTCKHVCLKS